MRSWKRSGEVTGPSLKWGTHSHGQLNPMTMGSPFERWSCDLAGPFPRSHNGFVYILTAVCVFSKFLILIPLRDKSAIAVAHALWKYVFLQFGVGELLTDNGTDFRNDVLTELCRLFGVSRAFTTAYQPRTNAVCERSHGTVNAMMSKCVAHNHKD